ncbi:hypothetical protein ACJ73_00864 [Blastomyces percursus]|uniref:Aminoglycoside phosphotransferase domain-containing protein n=1 Tax=Blastomyces percursus TaxID=1658174 RepID=A0A1J9RJG0_9EURO|nr:hypothetical protein ACJ73_00864 [Blastomyces percursus]
MWEPASLPFKSNSLPPHLPLPTPEEVRSCPHILGQRMNARIVKVNEEIVVKFGGSISTWEGQALIYLEQHVPAVPAPRLYAMYYDSDQLFLVMQCVPGVQLDSIWPSLTESEKVGVTTKLRQIFDAMRRAACPWPNFFGGLDGSGIHHSLFYSRKNVDHGFLGPFHGGAAFAAGLTGNFRALTERNGRADFKVRLYEAQLPGMLQDCRPILTHGDVQQRNIMVVESSRQSGQGDRSFDIVLVDWENAGWCPDFWELFCASSLFDACYWEEEWCLRVQEFLPVSSLPGLAVMRMLNEDLDGENPK